MLKKDDGDIFFAVKRMCPNMSDEDAEKVKQLFIKGLKKALEQTFEERRKATEQLNNNVNEYAKDVVKLDE